MVYYEADFDDEESADSLRSKKTRDIAWVRNDRFRRQLRKKFFSEKPGMTQEECYPLDHTGERIYMNSEAATDGGCYSLNHVNHLYMTKRGYVRQFRGYVKWYHGGTFFGIGSKNRDASKITNRRIRYERIDPDEGESHRYSTYKKKYAPAPEDVI